MATTPESFVDALNSAFGKQTTQRAAHAKGVVLLGKFVPSAEAASVSNLPALLPAGIEPADPMIQFRNKTYPVSYERRH
jgi:catalase